MLHKFLAIRNWEITKQPISSTLSFSHCVNISVTCSMSFNWMDMPLKSMTSSVDVHDDKA